MTAARRPAMARRARLPLVVGVSLALFQRVTGLNAVIHFAPVIVQAAGLSSASILATAGVGVVDVVTTAVAIRVGHRVLSGLAGMGSASAGWRSGSRSAVGRWSVGWRRGA